jgi:hypothetical protein
VHAACTRRALPTCCAPRCVLVCTGVWGKARRLQVEGAELPHVLTRYDEPIRFWRKRVLIVGRATRQARQPFDSPTPTRMCGWR